MTDKQWSDLLAVVDGKPCAGAPPVAFIIDSPWLPNWQGATLLDYFTSEKVWFDLNRHAIAQFPEVMFLPGFWSEYGMCTEPSAFGAKCMFPRNEFPFAGPTITEVEQIDKLQEPDPEKDGLLPLVLNRLVLAQPQIEAMGHKIRFAVARGPLNIASFLMGTTDFLVALKTEPERTHQLLRLITNFLKKWIALQRAALPSIDGVMMLDDLVGFISEEDFLEFAQPYLKELYDVDVKVKFFHNDADCTASVRHYPDIGINLYNPGVHLTLAQIRERTGHRMTILGTIPPRDVLAKGTPAEVRAAVKQLLADTPDRSRLLLSCAGGMPPGVSTENIEVFLEAAAG
jgi:uroporphyrinogen decarboxylase